MSQSDGEPAWQGKTYNASKDKKHLTGINKEVIFRKRDEDFTYKSTKIEHGEIEDYQWKEWVNSLISGDVDERVHCTRLHSKWD